jgi:hypothetical protein
MSSSCRADWSWKSWVVWTVMFNLVLCTLWKINNSNVLSTDFFPSNFPYDFLGHRNYKCITIYETKVIWKQKSPFWQSYWGVLVNKELDIFDVESLMNLKYENIYETHLSFFTMTGISWGRSECMAWWWDSVHLLEFTELQSCGIWPILNTSL